jgi:hypothetical protein
MIDIHLIVASMVALAYTALALVHKSRYGLHTSPDGEYYFKAGRGESVPVPYSLRPLVPMVCGDSYTKWYYLTYLHIALVGFASYLLGINYGLTVAQAITVSACIAVSRSFVKMQAYYPALVDAHSHAWAMMIAVAALSGNTTIAMVLAIIGGLVSEKVPVFAAIYAWSFAPLIGVLATALHFIMAKHDNTRQGIAWLDKPFEAAIENIASKFQNGTWHVYFLAPIGVAWLGLLGNSTPAYVALVFAALPVLRAMDYTRLITWGLPLLLIEAVRLTPAPFLPLLPLIHQYIVETEC